ncbi:hypothetical protein Bwad004_05210 [Bilophila wadsworthia]|uniref:hypothetical protein n=1 Tax=Bilophila wadsworthia TaxID=35833 RepID=UPI003A8B0D81
MARRKSAPHPGRTVAPIRNVPPGTAMQGRGVPETIRRTVPENAAPVGRVRASASLMRRVPTAR